MNGQPMWGEHTQWGATHPWRGRASQLCPSRGEAPRGRSQTQQDKCCVRSPEDPDVETERRGGAPGAGQGSGGCFARTEAQLGRGTGPLEAGGDGCTA